MANRTFFCFVFLFPGDLGSFCVSRVCSLSGRAYVLSSMVKCRSMIYDGSSIFPGFILNFVLIRYKFETKSLLALICVTPGTNGFIILL